VAVSGIIVVGRDVILHMGLPWRVEEHGRIVARFADRSRAVDYAYGLYQEGGGSLGGMEVIIAEDRRRTP
jgi:hypothetical protein